jgi:hypothetical protein
MGLIQGCNEGCLIGLEPAAAMFSEAYMIFPPDVRCVASGAAKDVGDGLGQGPR